MMFSFHYSGLLVTSATTWINGSPQQICITPHRLPAVYVTVSVVHISDVDAVYNTTEVIFSAAGAFR
jgi:hypothetical protein